MVGTRAGRLGAIGFALERGASAEVMANPDSGGREYFRYAGLGFEFAGVVGLFFYFGHLIDRRWGTAPWGLLLGGGFGMLGGVYHLAKEGAKMMRTLDGDKRFRRGSSDDQER